MKHARTWQRAGWALFSSTIAACALQAQEVAKEPKPIDKSSMLKIIDPELLARMVDLARSAKNCNVDEQPFCTIEMRTLNHSGKDYCVAVAPEVFVKTDASAGPGNKRRIVWKLDTNALLGKALAFHPDAGIIITVNQFGQVDNWGALGDGMPGPVLKHFFFTRTLRRIHNARATYLPVVLWGPSGDEELCAAIDPKIVNI